MSLIRYSLPFYLLFLWNFWIRRLQFETSLCYAGLAPTSTIGFLVCSATFIVPPLPFFQSNLFHSCEVPIKRQDVPCLKSFLPVCEGFNFSFSSVNRLLFFPVRGLSAEFSFLPSLVLNCGPPFRIDNCAVV